MRPSKQTVELIKAYINDRMTKCPGIKLRNLITFLKHELTETVKDLSEDYIYHLASRLMNEIKKEQLTNNIIRVTTTENGGSTIILRGSSEEPQRATVTLTTATYSYPPKKEVVGIIGDTHEPFCYPGYLEFCVETFKRYGVTKVVHIGDEIDNHGLSYHEKHIDAMSGKDESERAQSMLNKWFTAFPEVTVIVGNHSALPHRKATTAGIPKKWLKTPEEAWKAPAGWKWEMDTVIDNVLYTHGIGCTSSPSGAIDKALRSRQSVVIGHIHAFGGVQYHASNNDLIFGLNVGCGIDAKTYAFEYGKNFNNKPTLGCGIVIEGHDAIFVPMNLGSKYVLS